MKTNKRSKDINFIIGVIILIIAMAFVIVGFFYTPHDPNKMNNVMKNMAPSLKYPFGTDNFGRDVLSRAMEGAGTTVIIAAITVSIGLVFGIVVGGITGYFGGILDEVLMRINDAIASFPSILLALVLISIFGPGKYNITFALGIAFIPSFTRVIRSEFITLRDREFVQNARLLGAGNFRIIFIHILPNTKEILLSAVAVGFNNAILAEAGMSFLGLGVQPPDASLGRMLSEAQAYLFNAPWVALTSGLTIVFIVLGFSMISGGRPYE